MNGYSSANKRQRLLGGYYAGPRFVSQHQPTILNGPVLGRDWPFLQAPPPRSSMEGVFDNVVWSSPAGAIQAAHPRHTEGGMDTRCMECGERSGVTGSLVDNIVITPFGIGCKSCKCPIGMGKDAIEKHFLREHHQSADNIGDYVSYANYKVGLLAKEKSDYWGYVDISVDGYVCSCEKAFRDNTHIARHCREKKTQCDPTKVRQEKVHVTKCGRTKSTTALYRSSKVRKYQGRQVAEKDSPLLPPDYFGNSNLPKEKDFGGNCQSWTGCY